MSDSQTTNIAVFIDFENIALSAVKEFSEFDLGLLLAPIHEMGRVTVKRAYGDWSRLGRYRDALRENSVDSVQLFSYSPQDGGKNRADIRLVIDAMECLLTLKYINIIVIVSGDSDFSSLASKAREYGKYTIGIGVKASTSDLLYKACDKFIFYDELVEKAYDQLKARRDESLSAEPERVSEPAGLAAVPSRVTPGSIVQAASAGPLAPELPTAAVSQPAALNEPPHTEEPPRPAVVVRPLTVTVAPITTISTTAAASTSTASAATAESRSERDTLRYFFEDLRLPITPPDIRAQITAELLDVAEPGTSLNQAVDKLKARYDYENVYRKRDDIRTVAKLAMRAGLFDFGRECPSLASFVRRVAERDQEQANRRVDKALLRIALEANLTLTASGTTPVLFAQTRDERYCIDLLDELADEKIADDERGEYFLRQTDTVSRLLGKPELAEVKRDLEREVIGAGDEVSLEEADRLFDQASEWRRRDFVASAGAALRGLKMYAELYRQGEPGLGPDEFLWGAASYCSARAGACFRNRDYILSRQYYLTFFWIAQEGEFAWELLRPLLPSLLSYYLMTVSHEVRVRVPSFNGHNPPGDTALALVAELDSYDLKKMEDLAFELATANAAQLRSLIAQIEAAPASHQQQRALAILNAAHERFRAS